MPKPTYTPNTENIFMGPAILEYNGTVLGATVNDSIKINQLNLNEDNKVTFKVESKENAKNKGGFNIFGKNFGDYNQDIEMSVKYEG